MHWARWRAAATFVARAARRACAARSRWQPRSAARRRHFPALTGQIVDDANLLTPEDRPPSKPSSRRSRRSPPTSSWSSRCRRSGLRDRGLRLPARPHVGHRPEGQEQRRPAHRGAERAQSADRGRTRAWSRIVTDLMSKHHHRERHPAGVPARRFQRPASVPACATSRTCCWATRKPSRSARAATGADGGRTGCRSSDDRVLDRGRRLHHLRAVSATPTNQARQANQVSGPSADVRRRGGGPVIIDPGRRRPASGAEDGHRAETAAAASPAAAAISAAAAHREAGRRQDGAPRGRTRP